MPVTTIECRFLAHCRLEAGSFVHLYIQSVSWHWIIYNLQYCCMFHGLCAQVPWFAFPMLGCSSAIQFGIPWARSLIKCLLLLMYHVICLGKRGTPLLSHSSPETLCNERSCFLLWLLQIIYLTEDRSFFFFVFFIPSRFGPPFLMREDRSISWDQLQQSILSKLYYLMINGAQAQVLLLLFFLSQLKFMCLFIHSNPCFPTLRMGSCIRRNFYQFVMLKQRQLLGLWRKSMLEFILIRDTYMGKYMSKTYILAFSVPSSFSLGLDGSFQRRSSYFVWQYVRMEYYVFRENNRVSSC